MEEKNKNGVIVCLILIIVVLIVIVGYLLLFKKNNDMPKDVVPTNDKSQTVEGNVGLKKENTVNYTKELVVYYDKDKSFCYEKDDDCNESISIKVEADEASMVDFYKDMYIFYKDNNKYKVYNLQDKESYIINFTKNVSDEYISFEIDEFTKDLVGIIYREQEKGKDSFYSVKLNKVLYDKKYDNLSVLSGKYLSGSDVKCTKDDEDYEECPSVKEYLLSANEEKVLLSSNVDNTEDRIQRYELLYNDKATYFAFYSYSISHDKYDHYSVIYTEDLNEIAKDVVVDYCDIGTDGNLYIGKKGMVSVYDKTGKLLKTSKKYEIEKVIGEYILTIKDSKLILVDPDGKEIVLTTWKKKTMHLHTALSGWYTEGGKDGVYIVVQDDNASVDEVWKSCQKYNCEDVESKSDVEGNNRGFEYYYIPKTGEVGKIGTIIGGYAKPVLYLYPEKRTNVTITFDKKENLTTTYPKYIDSWNVTANPNGDLYDKNNNYYYGLYWEEKANHRVDFNEGFYVSKENAINFLEEKLSYLGFNNRERNEFIMYWLPILERNEHSLVYFEQTQERDRYSKINISPKPDSILRIAIHVKKVDGKTDIKEQALNTFDRHGFSVIEWGGVNY